MLLIAFIFLNGFASGAGLAEEWEKVKNQGAKAKQWLIDHGLWQPIVDALNSQGEWAAKNVCKQLEKNPTCEIVALKGMEWIRINGKAVLEKDFALADEFLGQEKNKHLKEMYEKNNWKLMIFHIEGTVEIIKMMKAADTFEI